jgi:hypothetical protein
MGGFSSSCTGTIRSAPGCAQSGNPHRPEAIRVPVARTRSPTTNAVPCDGSRPVPRPTSTPRRPRCGPVAILRDYIITEAKQPISCPAASAVHSNARSWIRALIRGLI